MTELSNTHPNPGDNESVILIGSDLAGTSLQDAFKKNFDAGNSSDHKKTSDLGSNDVNETDSALPSMYPVNGSNLSSKVSTTANKLPALNNNAPNTKQKQQVQRRQRSVSHSDESPTKPSGKDKEKMATSVSPVR